MTDLKNPAGKIALRCYNTSKIMTLVTKNVGLVTKFAVLVIKFEGLVTIFEGEQVRQ